jgi:hypothetical protein
VRSGFLDDVKEKVHDVSTMRDDMMMQMLTQLRMTKMLMFLYVLHICMIMMIS